MWIIELQLCDDDVYKLNQVYQSDKAKKYYQRLFDEGSINESSSIDLITNRYWGLGNVNRKQGRFDIALAYYCLTIELCPDRFNLLVRSYKYISLAYLDIHTITNALEYRIKTLEIQ